MATVIMMTIGSSKTKVCEINTATRVATIERAFTVENPKGYASDGKLLNLDGLTEMLREKLIENGVTGNEVIFVLKSSKIVYKEVYTPVLKGKKLKDYIRANASDYFPMDVENFVIAEKIISQVETQDGGKQLRLGLYAAAKDMVEDYYELAERMGLIVRNVESYNNATVAFLNKQVDEETSVVIHVHDDSTTVNIYKNNILELQRNVPYGKDVVVRAVMEEKELSAEAAEELLATKGLIHSTFDGEPITESLRYFVNGIIRVVDYYTSRNANNTVQKAYLTGESMNILGLESLFVNEFMKNTEQIKKFRSITVSASYRFEAKMIAKYISCIGGYFEPVHFTSEREAEKRKKERGTMYITIGLIASIAVGATLILLPFIQGMTLKSEISGLEEKIESVRDIEQIVIDHYNAKDKISDINQFITASSSANDYLLEFIKAMEKGLPGDVSIRSLSVNNGQVTLAATTSNKSTVAKFITQLKSIPGVSGVYVSNTTEEKDAFGVVNTTFNAVFVFNGNIQSYVNSVEEETEAEGEVE